MQGHRRRRETQRSSATSISKRHRIYFMERDTKRGGGGKTMRKLRLLAFLWVIFTASLMGQDRVSLSAPILKSRT